MRSAFEILSLPDLSLPKYFDLFGDEALPVAVSRLFSWLQLCLSGRPGSSFTLRYVYDPKRSAQERLRMFVVLSGPGEHEVDGTGMGQRLVEDVLDIKPVTIEWANPPLDDFLHMAIIERQATVVQSGGGVSFVPAVWDRGQTARDASEPYLDEAFAALDESAFLEVQLHLCDGHPARRALRSAVDNYEMQQQKGQSGLGTVVQHYTALAEAIADDPVCRLLVCAGSKRAGVAESLLRRFGIDAIGGSRFRARCLDSDDGARNACQKAVLKGDYEFADATGWFDSRLRDSLPVRNAALAANQMIALRELSELSVLVGPAVARDVVALPIPRRGYLRTFPLETERTRLASTPDPTSKSGSVVLGRSYEREAEISVPLPDLTRHAFVAGVTGSGKSVTMFNILRQLGEQEVPFLVLEPAKSEYRNLLGVPALRESLRVYTPGKDSVSPLRINPFAVPAGISLSTHIAGLSASFSCALNLFQPLSTVLEATLWDLYESNGWLEDDSGSATKALPRVDEIPEAACDAIEAMGYDPEIRDRFKGALRSRFLRMSRGSIGRLFDCTLSVPSIGDLCQAQSVVELGALSQQEANLVTMFLLTAIREHLHDLPSVADPGPRLVVVLEEAHNLVPSVPDDSGGSDETSAKAESSRYISNMLAEMRALGLAIIVVDQAPSAVSSHVVRNTNLKIAHRTVAKADRETLADAMLMQPTHSDLMGRLLPGQAYVYADRFYRPHLMQAPYVVPHLPLAQKKRRRAKTGDTSVDDASLLVEISKRPWFKEGLAERASELRTRCEGLVDLALTLGEDIHRAWLSHVKKNSQSTSDAFVSPVSPWREQVGAIVRATRSMEADYRAMTAAAEIGGMDFPAMPGVDALGKAVGAISGVLSQIEGPVGTLDGGTDGQE